MLIIRFIIYLSALFTPNEYRLYFFFFALLLWEIISSQKAGKSTRETAEGAFLFGFLIGFTWLIVMVLAHPLNISFLVLILAAAEYVLIGLLFGLFGWGNARIYCYFFRDKSPLTKRILGAASMAGSAVLFLFVAFRLYLK